jgi:signal transduction histidine kinase
MSVQAILDKTESRVVTTDGGTSVSEVVKTLSSEKIGAVMVTGEEGELVGILSERDVISAISQGGDETCSPEMSVGDALVMMNENRIRHLPVVHEDKIVGLISIRDLLALALEMAETANKAKARFLANITHELRTPLNPIIGFSEILHKESLGPIGSEEYREYAESIFDSGEQLLALIDDVLEISKLDEVKDELDEENVIVSGIIHSAIEHFEPRSTQKQIEISVDADESWILRADREKVKRIIFILVSNAIKFTEPGGVVSVGTRWSDQFGCAICVSDTGIGIAEGDVGKALSPFGQVDGDLNRQYEGMGLGLPIAKHFVEIHGGSLYLESGEGIGTTVTARFPPDRIKRVTQTDVSLPRAINE